MCFLKYIEFSANSYIYYGIKLQRLQYRNTGHLIKTQKKFKYKPMDISYHMLSYIIKIFNFNYLSPEMT